MESELSPDKGKNNPPVPIKTYQWEDLRRAREAGGYPWTHLLKIPLEGEITAEDIIKETTPRRSMSREYSRSRTHSPDNRDIQRILNLDSSPGSSRKHGEEGEDEGMHIPNFSQEISVESEDDAIEQAAKAYVDKQVDSPIGTALLPPEEMKGNISPKSILKRKVPELHYIGVTETREKTKCCHPLVNKIKHLADKTLQKLEKNEREKSPLPKKKKNEKVQEIRQLKTSPGAVRRQKFGAIKLGDSDEVSKTLCIDTPPPKNKKEHIYEDIEDKNKSIEKSLHFSPEIERPGIEKDESESQKENESIAEKKSNTSQDPSLVVEDASSLKPEEHVMEKLHQTDDVKKEAILLDDEMESEEPNLEEIFQNQLDEVRSKNDSPNITITEILDENPEALNEQYNTVPIETSPTPSPQGNTRKLNEDIMLSTEWSKPSSKLRRWTSEGGHPIEKPIRPTREGSIQLYTPDVRCACQFFQCDSLLPERVNPVGTRPTSRASNLFSNNSDHEYEIIEKSTSNFIFNIQNNEEKPASNKTDDELSSTTSLERKFLRNDEEHDENTENASIHMDEDLINAENLQKDIEGRFFMSTPSTVSRTECEISTSQVDSSALENLPLQRGSRTDNKIQQRFKEGTGKLKSQAGKLKTKLQNIRAKQFTLPERPIINFPERPKIKMPERPKFSFPEKPKFTMPDRRRFSLPERPKFKKINISEKLHLGEYKFTLPDRPKFNVPDLSKFKMPERSKVNLSSLGRKKDSKNDTPEPSSDYKNEPTVEFEAKTYPRLFGRKKKTLSKTSSSPTLDRENTPPATFVFTRVQETSQETSYKNSSEQPREYGALGNKGEQNSFETTYNFDKLGTNYTENTQSGFTSERNAVSIPDVTASNQEYTHINELNNDEFFVRPRGISRENIQVREYLSDEIRQAFRIPKNVLAEMGSITGINDEYMYANEQEADPELMIDNNESVQYSTEDLNDKDDGYYTFPPIRPSRTKRKKKESEPFQYIDDNSNIKEQFSEVDLCLSVDQDFNTDMVNFGDNNIKSSFSGNQICPSSDLQSIHEYANDEVIEYPENVPIQSQTLPMPPKRKKKLRKHSLTDLKNLQSSDMWKGLHDEDIIVYRTEHEYIMPQADITFSEKSPVAPRRNRSRSSRGTSFCDDDRTSHGAESLTLDTQMPHIDQEKQNRNESPGYATVDKSSYFQSKDVRRSTSQTPPVRRRKSNSSERKYYTVGPSRPSVPDRPPRKKSSTSLMSLDGGINKRSVSTDLTQYVEIDEQFMDDTHIDLKSGEILNKMKDRPLPPPPRPPRVSKQGKKPDKSTDTKNENRNNVKENLSLAGNLYDISHEAMSVENIAEIEVSTQTDPLPDDIDYELDIEENLNISMSSSLKDVVNEDSINEKSYVKVIESVSRPISHSEKSLKLSDPKITELSKTSVGRTSPTVILVERRVSSPTRINEKDEILTEASLTVQHIDIDENQIPDVPPLPEPREIKTSKNVVIHNNDQAIERITDGSRDVILDNLITQRLQVSNLDVGRLNVSELQASKIMVSDIEGMTLQVTELDSKSGHISVSGIEFSQTVIDEIMKKFTEITTNQIAASQEHTTQEFFKPLSREEHTQTDESVTENEAIKPLTTRAPEEMHDKSSHQTEDGNERLPPPPPSRPVTIEDATTPPQRPPPPDLTPLLYSYLQDITAPPTSFYTTRTLRERPFAEFYEPHQPPPAPNRRSKRKPAAPYSETSSEDERPRPSPRRVPPPIKIHEPTITEAGAQFLRVCQNSISRTLRHIFNSFMSYISGAEDKKDMQMALVIFLVLVAGLIMFGLSDSRTIHHHHWEFFNPPDGKK